jgi:hypothetical protein
VTLEALRGSWEEAWPRALEIWSRFTKLGSPRWCFDGDDEEREGLKASFAMIRLVDHAVVISLRQINSAALTAYPLEVMAHEIGHHVYCPGDLTDQSRMIARMRRALPTKERHAPLVANLYADLLINDRLQRQAGLRMGEVYRTLANGSTDRMWTFYMRIYEILWSLPKQSLAAGEIDPALDSDAALGARLLRVYAKDWLRGAGRFAALCFTYLEGNDGDGVRRALRGWLDTEASPTREVPDGLTEIDEDEIEGAIHPALDPEVSGLDADTDGSERELQGDSAPRIRYREPGEYRELLRSVGVDLPDDEITVRYYRERAIPYLIRFPTREMPETTEPLPEGTEGWDFGESLEQLDIVESLMVSEKVIPGVTTRQRVFGTTAGSAPEREPLDLFLGVDCSGSMQNPAVQMSYPVLAGAIIAISALRAGARVMVTLSGDPGEHRSTEGFVRDEREVLSTLTGYLGTGYAFGIHHLHSAFEKRKPTDRPAHVMIITDHDMFAMLGEKRWNPSGWEMAKQSLDRARGGGTYLLHMQAQWARDEMARMKKDGFDVFTVVQWEDIIPFAQEFSRKKYE